ncbi:hypothetical protein [Alkalihalobacterium sp. APHAB7]|uniref:hypothetical protein n=1 Tax=Alkalihalobacterium sp. APHAB7 TaxID=3402081 RepID=UPI003AAD8A5C
MDRYISKNSFSRDSILPGEERTGTVSFFIDQFDLTPSKRAKEHGAGIFRFSIDVSNFPFLNSFENNKIYYKQKIGWDTHHVRMTFDVE